MDFREIVSRLTGISSPVFGVSWNPPESDRVIARRVLAFLVDRRVLFAPTEVKMPEHCVQSILEIRHGLDKLLHNNALRRLPDVLSRPAVIHLRETRKCMD